MAAFALAESNANIILTGRNERAGRVLVRRLKHRAPSSQIQFIAADLANQRQVRILAAAIAERFVDVSVLINNAGARFDTYHESADGIELTFATNHIGHFLLTNLLSERLVRAPAARVITVASSSHAGATAEGEWSVSRTSYDRRLAYAKSKLANVMFAYELAERFSRTHLTSNAVDPGGVASNFARNNGVASWLRHLAAHARQRDLVTSRTGASALVYLATSAEVVGVTGKYFRRGRQTESSAASRDRQASRRLWDLSLELTGLNGPTESIQA